MLLHHRQKRDRTVSGESGRDKPGRSAPDGDEKLRQAFNLLLEHAPVSRLRAGLETARTRVAGEAEPSGQSSAGPVGRDQEDDADRDLLMRISKGDKVAMRTLYERHFPGLSAFVRNRLNDPVEAADLVHDTFMEVWSRAGKFRGRSSVRSWIFAIARNKTVDRVRKLSRLSLAEPDETIADEAPQAETVISNAQDAARVRACLEALSPAQRAAIMLAFYEDMAYREIAEIEGVSEGTVKTRIFHAKKLLLHCLSK